MSDFKILLPNDVEFILGKMKEAGYLAHVVGGSVRDSFIGRELGDFDITTNALPEETKTVFLDYRTVDTGIKHGTVTLVLGGVPYEITTYRVDGDYKDNRHPDSVTFTACLEEDLARRDFTVNAMAYNPESGLSDPFNGSLDARSRLIRAVGDPYKRFDEDALRILRALRFAAVLGFDIEKNTAEAVVNRSHLLGSISKERVYTELKKLVMGTDATRILSEYSAVISPLIGGLKISRLPEKELYDRADIYARFASLFLLNSDTPSEDSERAFTELKTDKLTRSRVSMTLDAYGRVSFLDTKAALFTLARYGETVTRDALNLGILVGKFGDSEACTLDSAIDSGIPYTVSGLQVRGGDLAAAGLKGEKIGEALVALLYAVIEGKTENTKEMLIEYLKKL